MSNTQDCTNVAGWQMTYDWAIQNFKLLSQKIDEFITSPFFYGGPNNQIWSLQFYPQGETRGKADQVSLYLSRQSSDQSSTTINIEFSILKLHRIVARRIFDYKFDSSVKGRGFPQFTSKSNLMNAAGNDHFIIRCKISSIIPPVDESFNAYKSQLSDDLSALFKEPKFSDVTFIVGSERFQAHKSVLIARSPVFNAMFEHKKMVENIKNEVKIEDIDPMVVKAMLEFIYTGKVENLESLSIGLLAAANKYELVGLQVMCETILKDILHIENAIEILTLADLYDVNGLKRNAMDFVKRNFSEVMKTEDYKQMENCELLKELMCFIATQRS